MVFFVEPETENPNISVSLDLAAPQLRFITNILIGINQEPDVESLNPQHALLFCVGCGSCSVGKSGCILSMYIFHLAT